MASFLFESTRRHAYARSVEVDYGFGQTACAVAHAAGVWRPGGQRSPTLDSNISSEEDIVKI